MEIIQERKQVLLEEEASGAKGSAGKDLLTLLIRANVHDKDGGMSDEDVLARKHPALYSNVRSPLTPPIFRNTDVPDCWARDDECCDHLDSFWVKREFGCPKKTSGRTSDAQH